MKRKNNLFIISIILNIILVFSLIIILNINYTYKCGNYISNQKFFDYLIGRD